MTGPSAGSSEWLGEGYLFMYALGAALCPHKLLCRRRPGVEAGTWEGVALGARVTGDEMCLGRGGRKVDWVCYG